MSHRSHADLGGQAVDEAVIPEPEAEPFHAPWEARVLALTLAMGATGRWNLDMTRAVRESLPDYRALSYYEIWFASLVALLRRHGLVEEDELASGRPSDRTVQTLQVLRRERVATLLASGAPTRRPPSRAARFAVGSRVRTLATAADGHTRLPAYARGHAGIVEAVRGMHVFADAHAAGRGEEPQWLYTVVFSAAELWGEPARGQVSIDAFEPYLEPA